MNASQVAFLEIELNEADATISTVGPGAESVLGYRPGDLVGRPFRVLWPPDASRHVTNMSLDAPMAREATLVRQSGEPFPAWVALVPTGSSWPGGSRAWCVIYDLSPLRSGHDQLLERHRFLHEVIAGIQDGVSVLAEDLTIRYVNPVLARRYRHALPLVGKKCYRAFHNRSTPCQVCPSLKALRTGTLQVAVVPRTGPEGIATGWSELYAVPLLDPATQRATGVIEYSRDITSTRKVEAALRNAEERYRLLAENVSDVIWSVDSHGRFTYVSPSARERWGFSPEELLGRHLGDFLTPASRNALLEHVAAVSSGARAEASCGIEFLRKGGQVAWHEVRVSPLRDDTGAVVEVVGVSRDITERHHTEEELRQSLARAKLTLEATATALAVALEKRDPYTAGHEHRVSRLACAIAQKLGLSPEQIDAIRLAATLHDIGKLYVPAEILSKPGKLLPVEMEIVKQHPIVGYEILRHIPFAEPVAEVVLQHHERLNGSGYPSGLAGDSIRLEARIIAVADVVEAMASHRPYRPARGIPEALRELAEKQGILYDPDAVAACLQLFERNGFELRDSSDLEGWLL